MATLSELEERVERLERDLETVKARQRPEPRVFAGIELTDNDTLVQLFMDLYKELGIDVSGEPVDIAELHRQMIAEGVRPEDRIISSGIRELRGEEDDQ